MMTDLTTPVAATSMDKMHKLRREQEENGVEPIEESMEATNTAPSANAYPGGGGSGSGPRVSFNRDVHVKRFGG